MALMIDRETGSDKAEILVAVEKVTGVRFREKKLLEVALGMHPKRRKLKVFVCLGKDFSGSFEQTQITPSTLDFFGNCLVDFLAAKFAFDNSSPKTLKKRHTNMISNVNLARTFDRLYLEQYVAKGDRVSQLDNKSKGNVVESILAAIYLDGGLESATKFFDRWIVPGS